MSTEALRDLNMLPGSERINGSASKGILTKSCSENTNENFEKQQRKTSAALASTPISEEENKCSEVAVGVPEVEYIDSEHLNDLVDVDASLSTLLAELDSKDWVLVCEALNNVRRFSIFHKEVMLGTLDDVIPLVVKSLKNPRSAVCKTAVMASEDIFKAYGDLIIDTFDPLLVQLLLKSSQDKRFVCEAAVRALVAMTTWVSPALLLPKLQPHLKHKNPRIRAKASMCFCQSVPRLGPEGIKDFGVDKLIQIAASQLSDQLPESREAARTLLLELRTIFEESLLPSPPEESEKPEIHSWEHYCESKLPTLVAQAVLRATTSTTTTTRQAITREDLILGS